MHCYGLMKCCCVSISKRMDGNVPVSYSVLPWRCSDWIQDLSALIPDFPVTNPQTTTNIHHCLDRPLGWSPMLNIVCKPVMLPSFWSFPDQYQILANFHFYGEHHHCHYYIAGVTPSSRLYQFVNSRTWQIFNEIRFANLVRLAACSILMVFFWSI